MHCPEADTSKPRRKCAVVVGHRPSAPGALSVGGVHEYDFNVPIAQDLAAGVLDVDVEVVRRGDYHGAYSDLPGKVNATDADFALSLHFNSVDFTARGTEAVFCSVSAQGQHLAEIAQHEMLGALGLADRGIKPRLRSGRGGTLLWDTSMPCVICEPFFGSHAPDWHRASARKDMLTGAYARAISTFAATLR